MMTVFIDDREQSRVAPAYQYYKEDMGLQTYVLELHYGDYVFVDKDSNIKVAFEYKTVDDYISSLKDYRVFNQALNQSNKFDYHFVIVVGTDEDKKRVTDKQYWVTGHDLSDTEFYGGFASLVNFTSIIQVPNSKTAFGVMEQVARKCTSTRPVVKRFPKSRGSPAYRLLNNNVHRVGHVTAQNICDTLGLESVDDVLGLQKADLLKVNGVGEKTADTILLQLHDEFYE